MPSGFYIRTEKDKKKRLERMKGNKYYLERKQINETTRKKMSEAHKGKVGNYKGGITKIEGYQKEYQRKIRLITIEVLGNQCVKCGFLDKKALQIDHINGDGCKDRQERKIAGKANGSTYYKYVLQSFLKRENKYQLLCANCNWIKKYDNNENSKKVV